MKKFIAGIGQSDFRIFRESGYDFVDKSFFISDVLEDSSLVLLFPRPRRFGKTLNLSMLGHFLRKTKDDLLPLFDGLSVTRDPKAMAHFQRHPVIAMTFKDVKAKTFASALTGIRDQLVTVFREHRYLLDNSKLDSSTARKFLRVLNEEADMDELQYSFKWLSQALYEYHGERVVILIDEYDTPVQSGYMNDYFDDVVGFFRNFFSACLKDNSALFKGVLTGILRVSKENMFSGLNHIKVRTILHPDYATSFGFTENEVAAIIDPERLAEVRAWYNGYIFGGQVIYNPWSILNYIQEGRLEPYWVNTASTDLIETLALKQGLGLSEKSEALLSGGTIDVTVDSNIVLRHVDKSSEAFWNFLLFSGYLKTVDLKLEVGEYLAKLAIPNEEVRIVYRSLFKTWLHMADPEWECTDDLVKGLLAGDAGAVEENLETILLRAMSYQDPSANAPEKLYHGFILGLLVHLEKRYEVRSNREAGHGRADVSMRPRTPGAPGVVIEFKVKHKTQSVNAALEDAAKQVREKRYAEELVAAGVATVHEYAMVFDGKRATVKRVEDLLAKAAKAAKAKKSSAKTAKTAKTRRSR